jgi:alkanesulfonate monooxygenase SsuD/methylene tetrahydromethanopterin reductase-like flavin-dependent oxidoreductase (luciferase family)
MEEFAGYNVDPTADEANLESVVPILRKAFSGQDVKDGGRVAHVTPLPSSPNGPRLMIAADGERGAERAARLADMMMVDPTEPWPVVDAAVERFDRRLGHTRGELVLFVYGGLSDAGRDAAWNEVDGGFRYMRHNYDRWMGREPTREIPPPHYRLLLGTPAEVAEQALEYRRRYGDRVQLVLRCNYPGMADAAVRRQIELWGQAARMVRAKA